MIKAFDKKGPHAGKFSVKYKDDPNRWTHSLLREGYCESAVFYHGAINATRPCELNNWIQLFCEHGLVAFIAPW